MTMYLSLAVCIAGALIYGLMNEPAKALGKDMFWCGLLAFLLRYSATVSALR